MMVLNLPDTASLSDVIRAYCLKVIERQPCLKLAAKQIGKSRCTLSRWMGSWGMKMAWVSKDSPALKHPPAAPASRKLSALDTIKAEAAAVRAAGPRRKS